MLYFANLTSSQKNHIGWPQQPPTEKRLKFNIYFMILPGKTFFQNIKINLNLDYSEVLSSDFSGPKTSTASLTPVTSTASMALVTLTAFFIKKKSDPDGLIISSPIPVPFCGMDHQNPIFH